MNSHYFQLKFDQRHYVMYRLAFSKEMTWTVNKDDIIITETGIISIASTVALKELICQKVRDIRCTMYKVRVNHRTEGTHRQATSSVYSRAQSQNRPAKTYRSGMLFPKTRILCKCNRVCFINSGRQWFLWRELGGGGGYSYSTPNTVTRSKVTTNNIL